MRLVPIMTGDCRATIHTYIGVPSRYFTGNCTCGARYSSAERHEVEAMLLAHGARFTARTQGGAA